MNDKKQVLLIDDDPDVIEQLTAILKPAGFEVTSAQSEAEAEDALSRVEPDLAILDVMMEHKDSGFVLCHQIKKMYPDTPVILCTSVTAVTGMNFPSQENSSKPWIKADAVVNKPVRADVIMTQVRRLVEGL